MFCNNFNQNRLTRYHAVSCGKKTIRILCSKRGTLPAEVHTVATNWQLPNRPHRSVIWKLQWGPSRWCLPTSRKFFLKELVLSLSTTMYEHDAWSRIFFFVLLKDFKGDLFYLLSSLWMIRWTILFILRAGELSLPRCDLSSSYRSALDPYILLHSLTPAADEHKFHLHNLLPFFFYISFFFVKMSA